MQMTKLVWWPAGAALLCSPMKSTTSRPSDARPVGRRKKVSPYGGRLAGPPPVGERCRAFPVSVRESPKLKTRS